MSICSVKSDHRSAAVRRPPCVKGAVTVGDWGIVSGGSLGKLRILQQAPLARCTSPDKSEKNQPSKERQQKLQGRLQSPGVFRRMEDRMKKKGYLLQVL